MTAAFPFPFIDLLAGTASVSVADRGSGPAVLLLHAGGRAHVDAAAASRPDRVSRGPADPPELRWHTATIRVPTLVLWGEADRIVIPIYGRSLAAAIPDARFELIRGAGHFPQIEQPARVLEHIRQLMAG
jgi:pimeloyl-ACP methyl ester carboxylesterase